MPLCRLEKKLDSIQLEAALTKHSSGAYLLAAPKRIEEGELVSDSTVGAVIDFMRDMFDFVIVDCGHHFDEKSVAVCERSNSLIYVLESIRHFGALGVALHRSVRAPYAWRLNRTSRSIAFNPRTASRRSTWKTRSAMPMYVNIPRDDKSLELAELSGKDLWQVAAASALVEELRGARRVESPTSKPPKSARSRSSRGCSRPSARTLR